MGNESRCAVGQVAWTAVMIAADLVHTLQPVAAEEGWTVS